MRDLQQDAGAVSGFRVCANGAAVFEVCQNAQSVCNDAMALVVIDVGDHAHTAGIMFVGRIIKSGFCGQAGLCQSLRACRNFVCHVRRSLPVVRRLSLVPDEDRTTRV